MRTALGKIVEDLCALRPVTRVLLWVGFALGFVGTLTAWVLVICAGRLGEYWGLQFLADEVNAAVRQCVFILGLGAVLSECAQLEL
ncbi:MAG: hypothetical protein LBN05_04230 [Oscillospiraceae bacterium]|nr:hypothetical protein [Oscillospiraceae bacterium]